MTEPLKLGDAAVAHAQALVRCRSVTPDEGGALDYLQSVLAAAGFDCHRLPFKLDDGPQVDNLFARFGSDGPHLCFAGHTDVVPAGDTDGWEHDPFSGTIADGVLHGRGASDMKGGVAAFVAAALDRINAGTVPGSISFLITGDEEGPAVNGTKPVLAWMDENGHRPDHCLVGEPTNATQLGETIKIGRRGSLNIALTVRGKQGHVAYQHLANNPVTGLVRALNALTETPLDEGNAHFLPSNLEVTSIDVGNEAVNIIPAEASARMNIRFNDLHQPAGLEDHVRRVVSDSLAGSDLTMEMTARCSGESFRTEPGALQEALSAAIRVVSGCEPSLSTSGGTSDARFIKDYCPVLEYGLTNATIHQVNECARVADIEMLAETYAHFIGSYFSSVGSAASVSG